MVTLVKNKGTKERKLECDKLMPVIQVSRKLSCLCINSDGIFLPGPLLRRRQRPFFTPLRQSSLQRIGHIFNPCCESGQENEKEEEEDSRPES